MYWRPFDSILIHICILPLIMKYLSGLGIIRKSLRKYYWIVKKQGVDKYLAFDNS